jgi:hypothetical protein
MPDKSGATKPPWRMEPPRHCERSEAIQALHTGLDRFVAALLAMTTYQFAAASGCAKLQEWPNGSTMRA